jgi:hypothetical protein
MEMGLVGEPWLERANGQGQPQDSDDKDGWTLAVNRSWKFSRW